MYNLLEYSKNCRKTTGSLFNYYSDETNSFKEGNGNDAIRYSIRGSDSFDYKTSIIGKLENDDVEKDVEVIIPLKYLGNFWRNSNMLLINCEVSLTLSWYTNCVLTSNARRYALNPQPNPLVVEINNPIYVVFDISDCKLYVPVVILSAEEDNKLLSQLKSGFKRIIK